MFERVISFMKKITTKTQREVVPERHVLHLRRQQQEEYFEVSSTKAKVTAKQAKMLIEKFCTDFIEKSLPIDEKTKKLMSKDGGASQKSNQSAAAQNQSINGSSLDKTLNSDEISAQIKEKLGESFQGSGSGSVISGKTGQDV